MSAAYELDRFWNLTDTEWMEYSACRRDTDPKIFDGIPRGFGNSFDFSAAARKCAECLVRKNCLEDALDVGSKVIVENGRRFWLFQAGLTPAQLEAEYATRELAAA